jgi:hypothetical protein
VSFYYYFIVVTDLALVSAFASIFHSFLCMHYYAAYYKNCMFMKWHPSDVLLHLYYINNIKLVLIVNSLYVMVLVQWINKANFHNALFPVGNSWMAYIAVCASWLIRPEWDMQYGVSPISHHWSWRNIPRNPRSLGSGGDVTRGANETIDTSTGSIVSLNDCLSL